MNKSEIFVTRSYLPPMEEYQEEIKSIWDNHWLTNMGEKHRKLQKLLKEYLKVQELELLVNGHMAIEMTLQSMNLTGEVITTPFTFASTTHAIIRNGLKPVFCDIDPVNFTMDVNKLERLITDKTSAILPVHVYGNVCDVEAIQEIAKKYELKVIYDAAHAFGEEYRGKGIGSYGDASCFSFHATKVFNTIEGGAVSFSDRSIGEKLYDLKNFGIHGAENVTGIGANAKMNEFSAAMGLCNLKHVDEAISQRAYVDGLYRNRLQGIDGLQLNPVMTELKSNYAYFPIVIDEKKFGASRSQVFEALNENGIHARKYFYPLTSSFEAYNGKYDANDTPVALHVSKRVLTLPMYPELTEEDVNRVCDVIMECAEQ